MRSRPDHFLSSRWIRRVSGAALAIAIAAALVPVGLPAPELANACTLFTAAEATAALGAAVSPGVFQPLGRDEQCRYSTPSLSKTLSVAFHPLSRPDFAKLVKEDGLRPIPGSPGPTYTAPGGVLAWKNGTQISVVVRPPGAVSSRAELKLVGQVLARL